MTLSFVGYCACSCSSPCRCVPVGDVKLVCLALWRKREYLTFISIRFVEFRNQNFADYRSSIVLVFFKAHFKLDFQALLSKLTSLNVSVFSCHRVKIQLFIFFFIFFLLTEIFITTTSLTTLSLQNLRLQKITIKN